ncbi:hypothetical protein JIN85_04575 [Luteolibacter pohnpeiensis]|uniref:Peptidase M28 domain-containing protein n=1 Tax=Luteolibacter pohnpeiensis TaxID=454153 RepID=A0A934VV01_9BACT|nr:hypothetical protein [Luteolibacter pohnpeiensis]MBK1881675.1 hypothetical protein [Luteolibacter pohnpeiensis]
MSNPRTRKRWVAILLVGVPAWLLISALAGLWLYFWNEGKEKAIEQARFTQNISVPSLQDDLTKFVQIIGERNLSSEKAAANLGKASAMIQGSLGPSNTGYAIMLERSTGDFPIIQVRITGKSDQSPIWVVTSYDSRPGSPGVEANATGLTATIAAAQAMAGDTPLRSVHFVFLPHANDPTAPKEKTLDGLKQLIAKSADPSVVIYVEAMGARESLWLTAPDPNLAALSNTGEIGAVIAMDEAFPDGNAADFAKVLFSTGLPTLRVATRPAVAVSEPDDQPAPPTTVAASAGRLVDLIRRCAAK